MARAGSAFYPRADIALLLEMLKPVFKMDVITNVIHMY
jgi:hypothetical protein